MNTQAALDAYQGISIAGNVEGASPHRLVSLLLNGSINNINSAKVALVTGDIAAKGQHISRAIAIVDSLRASLDIEAGGEVSLNLGSIYDYAETRLLSANIENDEAMLDEVAAILKQIMNGWEMIPEDAR